MQELAKQFINHMASNKLKSRHQIGDYVVLSFPPAIIRNAKVESVSFTKSSVYYDVSIKMKRPEWEEPMYTSLTDISSVFVLKEGEELENI